MPSTCVHLPGLGLAHPPQLDLPVVAGRDDERQRRMESSEVDATVVSLKNIFYGGESVKGIKSSRLRVWRAPAQPGDVPNANSLVHGRTDDKVLFGVELGRHDVMRMSGQDSDAVARRAVPDTDRLVVRCGNLCPARVSDHEKLTQSQYILSRAFRDGTAQSERNRDDRAA